MKTMRDQKPRNVLPDRNFILSMQLNLLQRILAPWPRRAAPLLDVNCGDGSFLVPLWQLGFDAQGAEADPALRERAQKRKAPGLEVWAAGDDSLPFDDDSFDWVITHLRTGNSDGISACAREALRLAKRGVLLTFWNSASLAALCLGPSVRKAVWPGGSAPWWRVWRQMKALRSGRLTGMGVMAFPAATWNRHCRLSGCNKLLTWLPFGAWCAIRLDLAPLHPVTPLPLRIGRALRGAEPAMEYAKNSR